MNIDLRDLKAVVASFEEIVAEKGADYVYERPANDRCVYVHDGQPSCIVGHFIAKHDLYDSLDEIQEGEPASSVISPIGAWPAPDVQDFVDKLQGYQDSGIAWGVALEMAKDRLGGH